MPLLLFQKVLLLLLRTAPNKELSWCARVMKNWLLILLLWNLYCRKDFHGCFDQLQAVVGLTLCSDVGFPLDQQPLVTNAALYPLNGHSKLSVRVDKDDESLKSYHLKFYFNIDDPKNRKLEIILNTPGSKTPRELSLVASAVTEPNKVVSVRFVSPFQTVSAEGRF